jgi:uncharacterized protein YbjT (DUF2867 family)
MNLVVGATGVLGTEICRLLTAQGKRVRALVRSTSAQEKKAALKTFGVEMIEGDLKDKSSLENACKNVENIISTATSVVMKQEGDSFIKTDREGHLALIDAAEKNGVKRFVFVSFISIPLEFPLQTAKREVEQRLKNSKLTYTILQPTLFEEVWLGSHLGFDAAGAKARIYGTGHNKISWISFRDVAQFAVRSLETPAAANQVIPLGGPENLSPLEVVTIFEETTGKKFHIEHVPESALKLQYESTDDPTQKTFAALMLHYHQGSVVDTAPALQMMPMKLRTIRDYAASTM